MLTPSGRKPLERLVDRQVLKPGAFDIGARQLRAGRVRDGEAALGRAMDQMRDRRKVAASSGSAVNRLECGLATVVAMTADQPIDDGVFAEAADTPGATITSSPPSAIANRVR